MISVAGGSFITRWDFISTPSTFLLLARGHWAVLPAALLHWKKTEVGKWENKAGSGEAGWLSANVGMGEPEALKRDAPVGKELWQPPGWSACPEAQVGSSPAGCPGAVSALAGGCGKAAPRRAASTLWCHPTALPCRVVWFLPFHASEAFPGRQNSCWLSRERKGSVIAVVTGSSALRMCHVVLTSLLRVRVYAWKNLGCLLVGFNRSWSDSFFHLTVFKNVGFDRCCQTHLWISAALG